MRDPASCAAALTQAGTPDALVITPAINVRRRTRDLSDEDIRRVIELNLVGTFRLMRDFGEAMAESGRGGSIVVFSSIRAQVVEPGQSIYAATKAGALQAARTLASELGPSGVRVNAVAPGVVETPLTAPIKANPDWYGAYAAKTALGRWAQPSEMVGAVVFLCSDAGRYVTEQVFYRSADGTRIPMFLTRRRDLVRDGEREQNGQHEEAPLVRVPACQRARDTGFWTKRDFPRP